MPAVCNAAANFGPIPSIRSRSSGVLRFEGLVSGTALAAVFFGLVSLEDATSATTGFFDLRVLEVFVAVFFGLGWLEGTAGAASDPSPSAFPPVRCVLGISKVHFIVKTVRLVVKRGESMAVFQTFNVKQYAKGLLFKNGNFMSVLEPGEHKLFAVGQRFECVLCNVDAGVFEHPIKDYLIAKRPAVIADYIEVDLPYPRTAEIRYSAEFTKLEHRAGRALGITR